MEPSHLLLLAWSVVAFWALGQIWFAQIVIYPLFGLVGPDGYVDYHRFYTRRIPLPVIIPGFASFLVPIALAFFGPTVPAWMTVTNVAAGIIGLLVTVGLEIPRHARLEAKGKDDTVIAQLVAFNWPRTMSMTVQSAVTFLMLAHVSGAA